MKKLKLDPADLALSSLLQPSRVFSRSTIAGPQILLDVLRNYPLNSFRPDRTEFMIFSVPDIRKIRRICIDAIGWSTRPLFVPIMAADRRLPAPITSLCPPTRKFFVATLNTNEPTSRYSPAEQLFRRLLPADPPPSPFQPIYQFDPRV